MGTEEFLIILLKMNIFCYFFAFVDGILLDTTLQIFKSDKWKWNLFYKNCFYWDTFLCFILILITCLHIYKVFRFSCTKFSSAKCLYSILHTFYFFSISQWRISYSVLNTVINNVLIMSLTLESVCLNFHHFHVIL